MRPHTTAGVIEQVSAALTDLPESPILLASSRDSSAPESPVEVPKLDVPKVRPQTSAAQLEGNDVAEDGKERSKQPTLEDLGRALRERRQVHAWIDLEIHDDSMDGLPEVWEHLKAVINTWKALKSLTDFKLTNDHEILEANFRKELLRRIRPLTSMCSPLSSDRPVSSAPQVGIKPRLLGGVIDVLADNFPPAGQRGSVSDKGMAASYAFRLCGDEWSVDLTSNKHW
eukprot:CAMPEP_0179486064 /NCGR_PEP_ID=MMETSP0799-20121207/62486_1 /TAXON_ID=46947 /ORGANISM="Geminigera cryophila, Strain CCMP2564" /LENGTH=227 /DNA_ID=CAMNT_0021300685 /DNA_START=18 /DNA_END=698 /DNA_ORIENTATION=+